MLRSKELYIKNCKDCGMVFRTDIRNQQLCPSCKKKHKANSDKENSKQYKKSEPRSHRTIPDVIQIRPYTAIIEQYNQKHQTSYSYGQFELLRFLGKITKEEINDLQREKGAA